mgnify:FL=1
MTLKKYVIGFVLSLALTLLAYVVVTGGVVSGTALLWLLGGLALVQMIVQLVYFLHLGEEVGPRYRLQSFLYMAGALVIIVVGSIWIMQNLNYNMMNMSPDEKTQYMLKEHDKGF